MAGKKIAGYLLKIGRTYIEELGRGWDLNPGLGIHSPQG